MPSAACAWRCAAVWELVKEKTQLTEDDLINKIAELDAKDGVADGQLTQQSAAVRAVQSVVPPRQNKCIYCGCVQPVGNVFESI